MDIGCGRMTYKSRILKNAGRYIGVDHPRTSRLYRSIDTPDIYADATQIPLSNNSCDVALLLQVLEHLPDPVSALRETYRLLNKGGILILSTVQMYPLHDEPHDYLRFTKYGLRYLLDKAGFRIQKHIEEGNVFVLIFQSVNIYLFTLLQNAARASKGGFIYLLFFPLILDMTTLLNIFTIPFLPLDKNSRFRIVQTIVAKKK